MLWKLKDPVFFMNGWTSLMRIYTRTNYSQTLIKQPPSGKYVLRCSYVFFSVFSQSRALLWLCSCFPRIARQPVAWGAFHNVRPTKEWWNDNFQSTLANLEEWFLPFFYSFVESAPRWNLLRKKRAMSRFVKTERQVFQFHQSDLFGTTSVGDPEYSYHKEPKRTFSFDFQPKFPEFFFS